MWALQPVPVPGTGRRFLNLPRAAACYFHFALLTLEQALLSKPSPLLFSNRDVERKLKSSVFELIPFCKEEQIARWENGVESPTYKLRRAPLNLEELNSWGHLLAIWRENGTLTYVTPYGLCGYYPTCHHQKVLCLDFNPPGPRLHIVGATDEAIAETAALFLAVTGPSEADSNVTIVSHTQFDFRPVGSQCLSWAASSRHLILTRLTLSVEQSTFLATRSHPMLLTLHNCNFEDCGTAFVDALASRKTSFGSLALREDLTPFDIGVENMKRLLQVGTIKELILPLFQGDLVFLPFSAPVDHLKYEIETLSLHESALQCLPIVTKKLFLRIHHKYDRNFPTEPLCSFFRRVATLAHFVELKVAISTNGRVDRDFPDSVIQEIICAARSNLNLRSLELRYREDRRYLDRHMKTFFDGLKDHKELRRLKLNVSKDAFGPDFSYLREFLTYKRNVTVTTGFGRIHSDGSSIDKLYAFNRFYCGLASMVSAPERPILLGNVLMNSASNDFQRNALLLSNHSDVVHDFLQAVLLDEDHENVNSSPSTENNKRRRVI
jgi:hypothetical protein